MSLHRRQRGTAHANRRLRLAVEPLEDKRMLAVAPVFTDIVPQATITSTSDARITVTGEVAALANTTAIANESLLDGAFVYELFITTSSDILIVEGGIQNTPGVNVPGGWYNNPSLGIDTGPIDAALINQAPELLADAWSTTPGTTFSASGTLADLAVHADTTNDGAQSRFQFAQFALIPDANRRAAATFGGQIQTVNPPPTPGVQTLPFINQFEFSIAIGDFRVAPNSTPGTSVGTVRATDGDGDALSYSITSGNAAGVFTIDPTTGEISTAANLTASSYVLDVRVDDTENMSATTSVIIHVSDTANSGWHNTLNRFDVNADGLLTPLDALIVINELTSRDFSEAVTGVLSTSVAATSYFDVNGDGVAVPLDALQVINRLNELSSPAALSSSVAFSVPFDTAATEEESGDDFSSESIVDSIFADGDLDA